MMRTFLMGRFMHSLPKTKELRKLYRESSDTCKSRMFRYTLDFVPANKLGKLDEYLMENCCALKADDDLFKLYDGLREILARDRNKLETNHIDADNLLLTYIDSDLITETFNSIRKAYA